ncbi:MAG: hypothetical protein M0T77_15525 [Actinomycetota bacterium]|nr:hypothetical protein [Actinomycetota bacterium]
MGAKPPVLATLTVSSVLAPQIALIGLRVPLWLILTAAPLAGGETTLYNTLISSTMMANLPSESFGRATAAVSIGCTLLPPVAWGSRGPSPQSSARPG